MNLDYFVHGKTIRADLEIVDKQADIDELKLLLQDLLRELDAKHVRVSEIRSDFIT